MRKSSTFAVGFVLAGAAVLGVACGSTNTASSSVGTGPSPFNGTWSCTTTVTYTFTSPPSFQGHPITTTTNSSIVVDVNNGGSVTIETGSVDGGTGCSATWDTSGSSATLASGQSCKPTTVSNGVTYSFDVVYKTGTGSVTGDTMTFLAADTFTGSVMEGAVSVALAGTISGSSTCTK